MGGFAAVDAAWQTFAVDFAAAEWEKRNLIIGYLHMPLYLPGSNEFPHKGSSD
jgi:hypothetical protein